MYACTSSRLSRCSWGVGGGKYANTSSHGVKERASSAGSPQELLIGVEEKRARVVDYDNCDDEYISIQVQDSSPAT